MDQFLYDALKDYNIIMLDTQRAQLNCQNLLLQHLKDENKHNESIMEVLETIQGLIDNSIKNVLDGIKHYDAYGENIETMINITDNNINMISDTFHAIDKDL
jgi:hypothetical protein